MLAVQSSTSAQISFKLRKKISTSEIVQDETSNDVLVSIQTVTPPSKKELAASAGGRNRKRNKSRKRSRNKKRCKNRNGRTTFSTQLDSTEKVEAHVIVLDAGHGGNDPGTLGTIGTREKELLPSA